jgi:hypothetical protein
MPHHHPTDGEVLLWADLVRAEGVGPSFQQFHDHFGVPPLRCDVQARIMCLHTTKA